MIVPDVNLLLYAHFDAFPEHPRARRWWEGCVNGREPVGIALPAMFGFIRVATNRRIFDVAMDVAVAIQTVDGWLERDNVRLVLPGARHLEISFRLLRELGTGANLTTDVQLAALAIEHQAELHSADLDFGRLRGVTWLNPLVD